MLADPKYAEMKASGSTPHQVYTAVRGDGLDLLTAIRLLRHLFGLSLVDAKSVTCEVDSGISLRERQGMLVEPLERVFDELPHSGSRD